MIIDPTCFSFIKMWHSTGTEHTKLHRIIGSDKNQIMYIITAVRYLNRAFPVAVKLKPIARYLP